MTRNPDMEHDPQLAATYRAGANAEPPAHLDDAIRAAARREVAAGPRRAGIRRWAVPVSLAAVLVLSVSVVTMMREQGADRLDSLTLPPAETPAARMQSETMQSEIVKRESAEPPTAAAPEAMPKRRSAPPPAAAPVPPAAQAEAPAPAPALSGRAAEAERSVADSRAKAMAAESSRVEDSAARREYAPQPQLRSAPAPMADAVGGAGASAAKPAAPATAMSTAPAKSVLWQDLIKEPPEKWVQRIAELRRTGQTAAADALVAEFRRRFPDARVPEDLR
jgi:hypothetical protein